MEYEWDDNKNKFNLKKHGLSFEDAWCILEGSDPLLTCEDKRKNYGEVRYITMGLLLGRLIVLVYTPRSDKIRIISMRKANATENETYKKQIEEGEENEH